MQVRRQIVEYYDNDINWYSNGKYHRDGDLPSIYYFNQKTIDSVFYYKHGKCHRTTGPAIIEYFTKEKIYYYHGKQYASLEVMLMLEACK